jgi:DNA topoisomerase VI subunit A
MKSIGDVGVDDIKSDVAYVKEKEKQAQIVGPLTRRKNDIINYNRTVQELKYTEGPFYDITSIDTHTIRGRRMQNKIWKRELLRMKRERLKRENEETNTN